MSEHLDEIYTLGGFFGDWTHMFRLRNPAFPKSWSSPDIMYMGIDTGALTPSDETDAAGAPLTLLYGDDAVVSLSHRSQPMPFAEMDIDFHQIRFYQQGDFLLDTELGQLEVQPGDFVVVPKGLMYRETPRQSEGNVVVIFETREPIIGAEELWDSVGFTSFFIDYSGMKLPEPIGRAESVETEVRVKYKGDFQTLTYDFDPCSDVIGWLGDPVVYSLNVWDIPGLGSSHGFLPPPSAAVLMGRDKSFFFNVMSPKPFVHVPAPEGSFGAPGHMNDYDEVWFNVASSAPETNGHMWRQPPTIPHPGAKRPPFFPEEQPTERIRELKLNFDTRAPMTWTDAAQKAFLPDPRVSLYTSAMGTHIGAIPEEAKKFAAGTGSE